VYFLGLPWQSRRGSSFIWGVWHDAKYLADQIQIQRGYLAYGAADARRSVDSTVTTANRVLDHEAVSTASGAAR
jgi:putative flavoprotein involved in K+ transport